MAKISCYFSFLKFMKLFSPLLHLWCRFRYPVSTPEDVGTDLGIKVSNQLSFNEFIHCLMDPHQRPTKLIRFMPRAQAEEIFQSALRKEKFQSNSLFSYHFKGGWMEFILQFDEQSRLRRLYMRHKELKHKHELPIS